MTTRLTDDRLDSALRDLDAADRHLTPEQNARKEELLASILESPRAENVVPLRRRHGVLRWAIPAAAAAALVGVMTVSGGPGGESAAYASWTPGPAAVDAQTRAEVETACRENLAETLDTLGRPDSPMEAPTSTADAYRTVIAERRGGFLFVTMAADDGSVESCFFSASEPDKVRASGGGIATASSEPLKRLRASEIETSGPGTSSGPEGSFVYTQGRVGSDVTGVTLRTGGKTVHATVSHGWYAAWWPGQWTEEGAGSPLIAYDVTLRDGQVVKDAAVFDGRPDLAPTQIGGISVGGGIDDAGKRVSTVWGFVGDDVTEVTVRDGASRVTVPVTGGEFEAELPKSGAADPTPAYDLTLKDGRVLRDQSPTTN